MKKIVFLCFLLLLSSCSVTSSWQQQITTELKAFQSTKNKYKQNINNRYFSYYLPGDMRRDKSNLTSAILSYENVKILLNVNFADLIEKGDSDAFLAEEGFYRNSEHLFHQEGKFLSAEKKEVAYLCEVYQYEGQYLAALFTQNFHYYAYCPESKIYEVIRHILLIAKSMKVYEDEVLADFTGDVTIDFQKKQVDLFKMIIPKNGRLSDMLVDKEESQMITPSNELAPHKKKEE